MVDERVPERTGIVEGFEEEGIGGALTGLADMLLPQAGLPGQKDLGSIFNEFVEFSALGDVGDIAAAVDPNSGLDPLERIIAAAPFIGVGAAGVRQGYRRYASRAAQAATQAQLKAQVEAIRAATAEAVNAPSMSPPPGQSYNLTNPKLEDLGGADPTPVQSREQAAKFEQLAEESRSPFSQGVFRAETWSELVAAVDPRGQGQVGREAFLMSRLRGIGTAVIAQVRDPDLYGPAEGGVWYGPGEREFVAAKIAVAKYQKARDLGLLEETKTGVGLDIQLKDSRVLERIINLEVATSGIVGPDLQIGTGARIAQIIEGEVGTPDYTKPTVQVMYGLVDELLPTDRVWDWERSYPADWDGLRKRQQALDFDAFNGVGAANIARAIYQAPPQPGRSSYGVDSLRENNWYPRMNRTASILSEETPYSVTQVSGVLSALSASTPWVPDNLIGAIHVVLRTGRPDLTPNTAEYNRIFERAVLEAGWGDDLYKAVSEQGGLGAAEGVGQMFDQDPQGPGGQIDQQGLAGWYAQPENVTSPEGNLAGAADATKKEKVDLILKANLPPWLVLRGMKTNTFGRLGSDPSLADLATVDTHSDRVYFGSAWVDRPLAHEGYTDPKGIKAEETYHDPITGESVTGREVIERLDGMKDQGWSKAQIDRWKLTLAKFPSATAQARYLAQQRAHLLVRDEFGAEAGHEVQAASWGTAQSWDRGRLSKVLEGIETDDLAEFRRIAGQAVLDTAFYSHVEGNPVMERTPAGLVWNVNPTLTGTIPSAKTLDASRKGLQRPASGRVGSSIINVAETDGTITPYADPEVRGVSEVLRHASPSGLSVGRYRRYIANRARKVLSVLDHVSEVGEYRRADGRISAGVITTTTGGKPHPGMVPGDRLVVLVDPAQAARITDILNNSIPLTREEADAGVTLQGTSRNTVSPETIRNLTDAQFADLLKNNDWVAISAHQAGMDPLKSGNAMRELRRDIERAGGTILEARGNFPDDRFREPDEVNEDVADVAEQYMASAGLDYKPAVLATSVDEGRAQKISDAYEAMPAVDQASFESYEAFKAEIKAQYQALVDAGYQVVPSQGDPYGTTAPSREMMADVRENKRIQFFLTDLSDMPAGHPMAAQSGIVIDGHPLSYNDLFRAIHDVYGHARNSNQFGPLGEENAWRTHASMFSEKALPAMTAETRGQNSFVNYGPHMRGPSGLRRQGDPDYLSPAERPFADQKAALLPAEFSVVDQPQTSEPSFLVTGLSYADAVRLGQKYGQQAVASRHAMLNMDGTYHPATGEIATGDNIDPNGNTTVLVTGHSFSQGYDFDQAEPIGDADMLADEGTVSTPMRQITIDLGGEYGDFNWREIELLVQRIGRVPGARTRLYTHSLNRVPAGYTKAVESVVTDPTGVTGSILHRTGDTFARHQAEVWIPEWENATLSEDGFEGERSRRDPLDARSIMEIDEQAGLIWFDQDLAISVPPEASVTIGEKGSVFRSLRLDGSQVRELIVDTNGPVPMLVAGQGGLPPAPGRTMVTLTRGEVSKITPHAEADWADARDALSAAGLIPEGKKVKVEYVTESDQKYRPSIEWDYSPYDDFSASGIGTAPQVEEDVAMQERLQAAIPTFGKIRLGNANASTRALIESVVLKLHGRMAGYGSFVERHGPLPDEIWLPTTMQGQTGIQSARMKNGGQRSTVAAVTFYDPGAIALNEDYVVNVWNRGVHLPNVSTFVPEGVHDLEVTLIHEIGHLLTAGNTYEAQQRARHAYEDLRQVSEVLVSAYGATSPAEFFAEAFTRVVLEPDKAHPVLHDLVDDVLALTRDMYDVDMGDAE